MLQAHSFLWNYLWIAPNVILLVLAALLWRRGTWRQLPAFLAFAILSAVGDLAVFVADVLPSVSPANFWRIDWASLIVESLPKFIVIGDVFSRVLKPYPSISRLGRIVVSGLGAVVVLVATLVAAFSHGDSTIRLISGVHLLDQTVFMIELALIVIIFLFGAYFRLSWDRQSFGLLLGFGISACGQLAAWAIVANANPSQYGRTLLDFLEMATHHISVVIWFYYLLVAKNSGQQRTPKSPSAGSESSELHKEHLEVWNRELERLLQP
jgi:hypothetical protein